MVYQSFNSNDSSPTTWATSSHYAEWTTYADSYSNSTSEPPTTNETDVDERTFPGYTVWDNVSLQLYLWTNLLVTFAGSFLIFYIIYKHRRFHDAHFALLCVYMVGDLLQILGITPIALYLLISQSHVVPDWYCGVVGHLSHIGLCTGAHTLALNSFERFEYLCRPFKYDRTFTKLKTTIFVLFIWVLNTALILSLHFIEPRKFHTTTYLCNTSLPPIASILVWGVVAIPSLIVTGVAAYKIMLLLKTKVSELPGPAPIPAPIPPPIPAPIPPVGSDVSSVSASVQQQPQLPSQPSLLSVIQKSQRIILFTTGLLWVIMLPTTLLQTLIFRFGITWSDLETGQNMLAARITRGNNMCRYTLLPLLNLGMHLYTHRDLRNYFYGYVKHMLTCFKEDNVQVHVAPHSGINMPNN